MVCFISGLLIGGVVGFFAAGLCVAARETDQEREIYENDGNNDE